MAFTLFRILERVQRSRGTNVLSLLYYKLLSKEARIIVGNFT